MNDMLINLGRYKIANGLMKDTLKMGLSHLILEIVGATEAQYYGVSKIEGIHAKTNEEFRVKYYKYENQALKDCSFAQAIKTKEFINDNLLIFSEAPEDTRSYYVAEIIN